MNKMLMAMFDNDRAAEAGLKALRQLHADGDITLYASGVLAKDALGQVRVERSMDPGPAGTVAGLALGGLIGLLGGPVGMVVGAAAGSAIGAVRDFWMAGVGLDFIEEAGRLLQPGKFALVAEIEEEWIVPVDAALEAAGGEVIRRSRSEVAEAQYHQDIAALRAQIKSLEAEAAQAGGSAEVKLRAGLAAAKRDLDAAVQRASERVATLQQEADAKAESLQRQLGQAGDAAKARIEERMKRVKGAYHARGAKLSQAWDLTKQAFAG